MLFFSQLHLVLKFKKFECVCSALQCGAEKMPEFEKTLNASHSWLKLTQIADDIPDYKKYYRQRNKVPVFQFCIISASFVGSSFKLRNLVIGLTGSNVS